MRFRSRYGPLLLGGCLLVGSVPMRAALAAEFAGSAQGMFTYEEGDEVAFDLNSMNRGDNPFSPIRLLLATRARVNENADLYLEFPFDSNANSSLFLSYLRPFVRLSSLGGAEWLNLQAGRLPTVFGAYGERSNSTESGVMGVPLLFYYHSALRGDLLPPDADYFFQPGVRGEGYEPVTLNGRTSYTGVPPVYDSCWDIGVELYGSRRGLQYSLAGTQGTVSRPAMVKDFNDQKGVAGRLGYQVESGSLFGLRLGVSGGVGPYLSESVENDPAFPAGAEIGDYLNTAVGFDLSFARGPWQIYAEGARIAYEVPNIDPTLSLLSYYVEVVRDFGPSFSLGARQEAIVYSDLTSSTGAVEGWDFDIRRWEATANYRFAPGARLRLGVQSTRVPDAPEKDGEVYALQLQVWTR